MRTEKDYYYKISNTEGSNIEAFIYINYYNERMYPESCREEDDLIYGYMTLYDGSGNLEQDQMVTWDSI